MRNLTLAALAAGWLLAGVGVVAAQDTVRLGGPSAQAAIENHASTELVHWGRGHYGGGYYGRAYYGGGYYGRSYYGGGYYRPYYYGSYYRPYYYSAYYYAPSYCYPQTYYSSPSYYYPATQYYYYPIAGGSIQPPATTLQGNYRAPQQYVPPMPPANGNPTYQYDGGPRSTVPIPFPDANPSSPPRSVLPAEGRLVSQPAKTAGSTPKAAAPRVTYPAYGE